MEPSKRWYNYWPFLVALIVSIINVDGVVIPSLNLRHFSVFGFNIFDLSHIIPELSLLQIFLLTVAVSVPGNIFWYWFWGWLCKFIFGLVKGQKSVKEGIELGKEIEFAIKPVLKKKGLVDRVKEYLAETFNWATDENNKLLKRLKRGGYATIFFMSATPEPGGRVVATIFSRTFDSKRGLISLILGDTFKNFYMVFGFWNLLLRLPSFYFQIAIFVCLACFIGHVLYKKMKERPST